MMNDAEANDRMKNQNPSHQLSPMTNRKYLVSKLKNICVSASIEKRI